MIIDLKFIILAAGLVVVPWLATLLGSLGALRFKLENQGFQGALLGFAAGVMTSAAVWSLILPAFDEAPKGAAGALIVTLGFAGGCLLMLLLDKILPHVHIDNSVEGVSTNLSSHMLIVLAVALHNIPEGLALGVVISSVLTSGGVSAAGAVAFGAGLALQNLPEGMAVMLPMRMSGISERTAKRWGIIASFAEPAAAVIGFFLSMALSGLGGGVMAALLGLAAGAMVFIVVEELIPESQSMAKARGHGPTYGFLVGFWLMAVMGALMG